MTLKLALFVRQLSHGSLSRQGWVLGSEIWEQELVVRYPEWPRALVLSQRAVPGLGESCRDQPEQCRARLYQGEKSNHRANLGDIREMCP